MKYKALMVLAAVPIMLTGCMQSKEPELTPEELEHNALVDWFENGIGNEDKFPDLFPITTTMQELSDWIRTVLFSRICGKFSITKTST